MTISLLLSIGRQPKASRFSHRFYRTEGTLVSLCAAENACLETEALGPGTVVMSSFDEDKVGGLIDRTREEKPLLLLPLGVPS